MERPERDSATKRNVATHRRYAYVAEPLMREHHMARRRFIAVSDAISDRGPRCVMSRRIHFTWGRLDVVVCVGRARPPCRDSCPFPREREPLGEAGNLLGATDDNLEEEEQDDTLRRPPRRPTAWPTAWPYHVAPHCVANHCVAPHHVAPRAGRGRRLHGSVGTLIAQ